MTKGITEEQRAEIEAIGRWAVEFASSAWSSSTTIVLGNDAYEEMILGDAVHATRPTTWAWSTPTGQGQLLRRPGPRRRARRRAARHVRAGRVPRLDRRARRAVDLPQVPVPEEGRLEGLRRRRGLRRLLRRRRSARLNAADGMATPLAQEEYERFYATLAPAGERPASASSTSAWRPTGRASSSCSTPPSGCVELATDPEITSPDVRAVPTETPTEGVGTVEAPRGTLTHHYWTDERGVADEGQPDRRHDQQLRADRDVDRARRRAA